MTDTAPVGPSAAGSGARRILANTLYRAVADVVSKIASVVLYVVMARKLGEAEFGIFTFGFASVTLVTALASFGQDQILTREVARDRSRVHAYFANTLALKIVLAVPALALAMLVAQLAGLEARTQAVVLLLGIAIVADQLMATCFATYQAFEELLWLPVVLITQRFATAIVGVLALLAGADVVAVSGIYLAGAVLALALAIVLQYQHVVRARFRIDPSAWPPLMRKAAPVGIAIVFGTILFRVDAAILAAFESDEIVGNYGAAFRLFEATLFLSWSVGAAVYPVFSRLSRTSEPPVGLVYERSLKLLFAVTFPLAMGALVLGPALIRLLYGEEFDRAEDAMVLLAPAVALYPLAHIAGAFLVTQDRQLAVAVVHGLVAVQNVAANFVLIALFSLEGAAIATSITQVLLGLLCAWLARSSTSAVHWRRVLAGPLLATIASGAVMVALRDEFALALVAATLAYAAVLVAFERFVFPADADALRQLLVRRRSPLASE